MANLSLVPSNNEQDPCKPPTGEQKLQMVAQQIYEIQEHNAERVLHCPYCNTSCIPDTFCCPTMHRAVKVITDAQEKFSAEDKFERLRRHAHEN